MISWRSAPQSSTQSSTVRHDQARIRCYSKPLMQELRELLSGGPGDPGLDLGSSADRQHRISRSLLRALSSNCLIRTRANWASALALTADGEEFIQTMNEYLFEELGFQGNQQEYYHPANSCLNEVLTKRVGIPITLVGGVHGDRAAVWAAPFTASAFPVISSCSTKTSTSQHSSIPFTPAG